MDNSSRGSVLITQDSLLPGIIKPRHLVTGSAGALGEMDYGDGKGNFTNVLIGSTGQVLTVQGGKPVWAYLITVGLAADKPTSGVFAGQEYYASDTKILYLWDGSVWRHTAFT